MAPGDRPQVGGVDAVAPARATQDRHVAGVDGGRQQDRGAGRTDARDGVIEPLSDSVDIGARTQKVVATTHDAHQVRSQGQRIVDLSPGDVFQQPPADGQVRVAEHASLSCGVLGQVGGETVGPTDVRVRRFRMCVAQALGEGVADRDEAGERTRLGGDRHGAHCAGMATRVIRCPDPRPRASPAC